MTLTVYALSIIEYVWDIYNKYINMKKLHLSTISQYNFVGKSVEKYKKNGYLGRNFLRKTPTWKLHHCFFRAIFIEHLLET